MRYLFIYLLLFLSLSAYSQQKGKLSNASGSKPVNILSESDQRKFDFFLFEGAREKMLKNIDNSIANYAQCYSINNTSPVVLYELARLMNTKITDNIAFMETAVSLEPRNIFYLNYLANLYFKVGLNQLGIDTYIKIYNINPQDDEFTYQLARTAGYLGDVKTSMRYFDILEDHLGLNYAISIGRIEVFEKAKMIKKGELEYKRLIKGFPNSPEYETMLGQYYMSNGLYSKATSIFTPLSKKAQTAGEANLALALLSITRGDSVKALELFQVGLSDPLLTAERKMNYIKTLKGKDSYTISLLGNRTIQFLKSVIKFNPDDVEAPLYLSFYYETDLKDSDSSAIFLKLATTIDPESYDAWKFLLSNYGARSSFKEILEQGKIALLYFPNDPTLLYYYGIACSIEGFDLLAISSFELALKNLSGTDEDSSDLYGGLYGSLGDCYYKVDSIEKSFAAYDSALKLNPNNVVVLNNYAYYLSVKGLRLDKAEEMSARVVQLDPGNPTFLDTYAWVLFKLRRFVEAKFIIERAIDKGGDTISDVILEHYGDILSLVGSSTEAIKYWQLSLDKGNKSPSLQTKIQTGIYTE